MEDGAGEEGKEGGGPFYHAARANQATSERTDRPTNDERKARPRRTELLHSPTPSARPRPSVRRDCPTSAGGPVIKTVTRQKSKIIIVGKIYIQNHLR